MGLDVTLMPLNKILEDPHRARDHQTFLKQTGLIMPSGSNEDFHYTEQIGPYAILHHLWRYAAYLEVQGRPPSEPGSHPLDDPVYQLAIDKQKTHYDHLLRHSEDYGYYYPIDFPEILTIMPQQESGGFLKKVFGGTKPLQKPISYGSSIRLHQELLQLNEHLQVPVRDEVPSQTYADGIHGDEWGDEKWSWIVLYFMCRKSIEHGQIVVFE